MVYGRVKNRERIASNEEMLSSMFKQFDADKDGRLSYEDLKQAFKALGARFVAYRAYRALKFADANGDGFIDISEFDDLIKYTIRSGFALDPYAI